MVNNSKPNEQLNQRSGLSANYSSWLGYVANNDPTSTTDLKVFYTASNEYGLIENAYNGIMHSIDTLTK